MIKIINPKNIKNLAPMTPANLKLGDISTPQKLQKSNSRNINQVGKIYTCKNSISFKNNNISVPYFGETKTINETETS